MKLMPLILILLAGQALAQAPTKAQLRFVAAAKATVTADLKDPAAAQFRNLVIADSDGLPVLCGELNAKNSYGAYIGFRGFFSTEHTLKYIATEDGEVFERMKPQMCGKVVATVR